MVFGPQGKYGFQECSLCIIVVVVQRCRYMYIHGLQIHSMCFPTYQAGDIKCVTMVSIAGKVKKFKNQNNYAHVHDLQLYMYVWVRLNITMNLSSTLGNLTKQPGIINMGENRD